LAFCFHPGAKCFVFRQLLFGGEFAHVFGNSHGAEVWTTHGTEVSSLGAFHWKRLTKLMPIIFALAGWP
jgi:hypothetical protein